MDAELDRIRGSISPETVRAFRRDLTDWFDGARRAMPWREPGPDGRRDPYRVWVSEVMLQQTRVETAAPYFRRFTDRLPTVRALADADQDTVLKLWEGLGYYSRARNLHRAAQIVASEHGGRVPSDPDAFRALPGVGPYTAAAVLSLAFDEPLAVLDGNVIRVLSRVFALDADTRQGRTRKALQGVSDRLLDADRPGRWNESVMELGATVCTPRSPACPRCPLNGVCRAYALGTPQAFPVVSKREAVPHHVVAVGLVMDGDRVLIQKRPQDAMLGGLWEFPGGKAEPGESPEHACARELWEELGIRVEVGAPVARVEHAYSHFRVTLHAYRCRQLGGEPTTSTGEPLAWVAVGDLDDYAFPTANRKVIEALQAERLAPRLF